MRSGEVVGGRYVIAERHRSGGMADIYQATDQQTGRRVAVKVLRAAEQSESVARFEREARLLAALEHPAIVGYHAHGTTPEGDYYMVLEWLDGEDLNARLLRADLTIGETTRLVARVAEGLHQAHRAGVIHRDIKPGNLFLPEGKTARVKLIDFGIAQLTVGQTLQTDPKITLGSPGYMAPEQARTGGEVTLRSDLYSLGCVLFRCLTGRRPFEGDNPMAVLLKTVIETPPRVSDLRADVPPRLDELVASMLAKDPDDRPASAFEVAELLTAIVPSTTRPHARRARPTPGLTSIEQRIVSLVLADVGFRAETGVVSRARTDEREVLLAALAERVAETGGTLHQVTDALFAVTLEGAAAKQQSSRAASCALAMNEVAPGAPIALTTGRANVLPLPVGEVIDRAVALVERVKSSRNRAPDERIEVAVRLDDATAGLLDARYHVIHDGMGPILRGERTVEAARTLLGRPTQFVGRIRELGFLEAIFDETVADSTANATLVTAAAGVGKSRLRHEFTRALRRRRRAIELWVGRGDPIGAGSPFSTIAPAIRRTAGFAPGDTDTDRLDKLLERLSRTLSGRTLGRVWNFLAELVGVHSPTKTDVQLNAARADPIVMGDQMKRAWLDWLAAELDAQPVVLILEDLHWGDRPSISFVDEALKLYADKPFMVLALARPDVASEFPDLWAERRLTHIELRELSRNASRQLVVDVLGDAVDDGTIDELVARAGGNAFYLEELIRAVAHGHSDLPESVLAMVQTRLEEVDAECRKILRAASVFGRVFTPSGVRALLGGPGEAPHVRARLREMADRELITRRAVTGPADDLSYTFRHALLRDAAYAMLTDEDRELGHRLAGTWLEQRGNTDPVVLAQHYELGARPQRAFAWYERAASQALEGNDFQAVHERCARGLECASKPAGRGRLLVMRAQACRWQGQHDDTLTFALAAMRELSPGSTQWLFAAGLAATSAGNTNNATILLDLARSLREVSPTAKAIGAYLIALSRAGDRLLMMGHYEEAEQLVERLGQLSTHRASREPSVAGWIRRMRGFHALFRGDPATFTLEMLTAVRKFEQAGDARNSCLQRGNAGYGYLQAGDYARAIELLRASLEIAVANKLGNVITSVQVDLGHALARLGETGEAVECLTQAAERCAEQRIKRLEGPARCYLAAALIDAGDLARAREEALRGVELTADHLPARAMALATLANVELAAGAPEAALRSANRAMGQLQLLGGTGEGESLVRLAYAESLLAAGQEKAARDAVTIARDRVWARADLITRDDFRTHFIEGERSNAGTLTLARGLVPSDESR